METVDKAARAAYMRAYYRKNTEKMKAAARLRNQKPERKLYDKKRGENQRKLAYSVVDAIKLNRGCIDCGYKENARALEFDHVRGEKFAEIATLIRNRRSIPMILLEIEKCEVRCANCHKIKTWGKT